MALEENQQESAPQIPEVQKSLQAPNEEQQKIIDKYLTRIGEFRDMAEKTGYDATVVKDLERAQSDFATYIMTQGIKLEEDAQVSLEEDIWHRPNLQSVEIPNAVPVDTTGERADPDAQERLKNLGKFTGEEAPDSMAA